MKTPTTSQRIKALVAFINAEDVRQGRPADVADRTAAASDLNVRLSSNHYGDHVLTACIDNHCPCEPFAVLSLDEAGTAKELPGDVNYTQENCVTVDGTVFLIVYLG